MTEEELDSAPVSSPGRVWTSSARRLNFPRLPTPGAWSGPRPPFELEGAPTAATTRQTWIVEPAVDARALYRTLGRTVKPFLAASIRATYIVVGY